jgi:putative membrane protein
MSVLRIIFVLLVGAYLTMWIGGVAHYIFLGGPPSHAPWAASVFLSLAGAIVAVTSPKRDLAAMSAAALIGFAAEVLGVRYGFIFSPYHYTGALQPQLFGVPLVMLSAWMALVSYARQMLIQFSLPRWLEALAAAVWMTAIDLVIDPLAANQLGYWRWAKSSAYYGIPLHNFAGWFMVSLIIFGFVRGQWRINRWARYVGLSIVVFFTAIAIAYHLTLAGAIGVGLLFIHLALIKPLRSKHSAESPAKSQA